MSDLTTTYLRNLPGYIQYGKKLCYLSITKDNETFIVKYSNTKDYFFSGNDIEAVLKKMIDKLKNPPSKKYTI